MSLKLFDRDMKDFMDRLRKMKPLDAELKVNLIRIAETGEECIEDFNDIWITIDSKTLRKNCFLSDQQKNLMKDLSQILYVIFKTRFLIPISELKIDYQNLLKGSTDTYFGKILITDDSSRALLRDIIDLNCMKEEPIGISNDYNLRDVLPQEFKRKYHLIYLISLSEMSDEEFDLFFNCLSMKESRSQSVFSFYILMNSGKRVKKLQLLRQTSTISGVFQLGCFQSIDHNMVVVDNKLNMNWLTKSTQTSYDDFSERLAIRLVNFLEQIGEFPTVFRYYKTYHKTNKLIADRVLKEMTEIANRRKELNEKKHENNYELLFIDRSLDLITPLIHCLQFRPFVFNELEKQYENDMNSEYRKLNTILVGDILQIRDIFNRLKDLYFKDNKVRDEVLIEKTNKNIENASEIFDKIKNTSYSQLLTIEKSILESKLCINSDKTSLKRLKKLFSRSDREVTNNDLIRVLIINGLFAKNDDKKSIKQLVEQNEKERQIDWTVIEDFVELTKDFVNTEDYSSTDPKISRIVSEFFDGSLSEEAYPMIYKKKLKDTKRKLILFILGGLSYNDLISIPDKYQNDVIFCANGLITSKMYINSIICV